MKKLLTAPNLAFTLVLTKASAALAQSNDEWVAPATGIVDSLTSGLVEIGIPIVGLGVVAAAVWAGLSGKMDWNRLTWIVVAGLLITAGPSMVGALFGDSGGGE